VNGYLSVFNIYNEITDNNTITCLDHFLDANIHIARPSDADSMVWLGDFNRHHPMWEDDANSHLFKPEPIIAPFLDLLYKHDMLIALPKGIPTFQTNAGRWT
jgi:hypothetical protein